MEIAPGEELMLLEIDNHWFQRGGGVLSYHVLVSFTAVFYYHYLKYNLGGI